MSAGQATEEANGYRLVFRAGLVWLLRGDGTVAHVSTWRPCRPAHASMAAGTLANIAAADWVARAS